MKKIFLVLALALTVSVANAWNKTADEGVVVLAKKHLSAEAKSLLNEYLGDTYGDDVMYLYNLERKKGAKHSKEIHYLHLDSKLQPTKVAGEDALAGIESALEVVRDRSSRSKGEVVKALRTIINLVCDMHNFSNVRIEGIAHSQQDYKVMCFGGDIGKRKVANPTPWSRFWNYYAGWHSGFSGDLWAEDLELSLGARRAEYSEGNLNAWATQIGEKASWLYGFIVPEYQMTRRQRNELEVLNCEMMALAGYRLAVLLNEVVK
jgi:hypothetical protein